MKKTLVLVLALVSMLALASSAFAAEPVCPNADTCPYYLATGECSLGDGCTYDGTPQYGMGYGAQMGQRMGGGMGRGAMAGGMGCGMGGGRCR